MLMKAGDLRDTGHTMALKYPVPCIAEALAVALRFAIRQDHSDGHDPRLSRTAHQGNTPVIRRKTAIDSCSSSTDTENIAPEGVGCTGEVDARDRDTCM
jgi:hypothetical protein